jgi:CBS domain-containing protein
MTVARIMKSKANHVISVKPDDTVAMLSRLLREKRIGAAIVSTDGAKVDGVISERDIAYGISNHGTEFRDLPVSALMTKVVITCSPADPIAKICSTMLSRNVRHLPVVQDERLVGMVSIRDVLRVHVEELQQETALLRMASGAIQPPQDR